MAARSIVYATLAASFLAFFALSTCKSSSPPAATGAICSACQFNDECASGSICAGGVCSRECAVESDCPSPSQGCRNGLCQCAARGSALVCAACTSTNNACGPGLLCRAGSCTKGCLSSAECPAPSTCNGTYGGCYCADAGAVVADAGPPDAGAGSPFEFLGDVDFGLGSTFAVAAFTQTTSKPYTCTTTTLSAANCTWVHCTGDFGGAAVASAQSAGVITISGGTRTVTLTPDTMSVYPSYYDATPAWAPGATITISAAGGAVPAFSATLAAPAALSLTSPTRDGGTFIIDRATPLALAWTGGAIGKLFITIAGPEAPGTTLIDNITCTFPAADGSGVVPVEALMKLSAGSAGAALGLSVADRKVVAAGAYTVTLQTFTRVTSTLVGVPLTIR